MKAEDRKRAARMILELARDIEEEAMTDLALHWRDENVIVLRAASLQAAATYVAAWDWAQPCN